MEVEEGKPTDFIKTDAKFHYFQSFTANMSHERLLQTHFQRLNSPNLSKGGHKDVWTLLSEATIHAQASDKATSNPASLLQAFPLISEHCISQRIFQQIPMCQ